MRSKIIIISVITFFLFSCNTDDKKYEEFFETYKDILIAREFSIDSILAKNSIDSILASRDLSEKKFRNLMFELMEDRERFFNRMQGLRDSIKQLKDSMGRE